MQNWKIFSLVAGDFEICNIKSKECKILKAAGKLRYNNISPIVGDFVEIQNNMIKSVFERKNEFIRPKVSNIDQVIIFMSIEQPKFSSFLIDKYMSIIEKKSIKPILFITKSDLNPSETEMWKKQYSNMGYEVYSINNKKLFDDDLKKIFQNKFSVFMGQSGVGKTTTLNNITNLSFKTQEISKALGRGKHTTRVVKIIPVFDGYLIDTPGFSSLEIELNSVELSKSFKMFKELSETCKFRDCLHINEKDADCAIKLAIKNNNIPLFRYENYLKLQKELQEKRK
ncbi:putative ribosome biogenesis gtpase rsga [Mycoplasmopsis canis PG 14]|uniref:Small ribosomal subunit biogenesis GTPase RsgA n=1 Tax=Mycoplasmopsis canis TaxID=29555 RepID=A0A449AR63_9BACT|nr:ribosome small subunit-dependent GTPase A [Mycoplasmopsis canis]AMD81435.1 ribosome biogenesis GTPase RsgA [Mycoplasmopsis canis PG 14]EIE39544.1 putative ribosome biogenesis gtpase rsga [Mycoplasmopsis canis PG 14]VEU69065.1 GTPase YjeQ/EngC [Mycoplasmopsis canis]